MIQAGPMLILIAPKRPMNPQKLIGRGVALEHKSSIGPKSVQGLQP